MDINHLRDRGVLHLLLLFPYLIIGIDITFDKHQEDNRNSQQKETSSLETVMSPIHSCLNVFLEYSLQWEPFTENETYPSQIGEG